MAKTISELRNQSIQVRDASAAGENTATRVGTVLNDIVGHIEDYENTQSSNNSSQDAKIEGVKSSLNAEIARAKTEESNLSTQIGTERTERQAAVSREETARIQADNDEKQARINADNAEQDARIKADNDEKTARENADITLRTMIQTEVSNRQIAVKQEEIRAMAAEKANTQAIADEVARAQEAELANTTAIEAEKNRAEAAEEANAQAIADETARATAEEERLQGEIDNTNTNLITLQDNVNSNYDHLTDEVARLDLADNEIKADLEAETARAQAIDNKLISVTNTHSLKIKGEIEIPVVTGIWQSSGNLNDSTDYKSTMQFLEKGDEYVFVEQINRVAFYDSEFNFLGVASNLSQIAVEYKYFRITYSSSVVVDDKVHIKIKNSLETITSGITIIGDSISTFAGFIPKEYPSYYPNETQDVKTVEQTYWKQIVEKFKLSFDNLSYSGSTVSNNNASLYIRSLKADKSAIYMIALGTNDSNRNVSLGQYEFEKPIAELNEAFFIPAYIKGIKSLKEKNPLSKFILVSMAMKDDYANAIKNIADYFGAMYIDARGFYDYGDEDWVHPDSSEMQDIADGIIRAISSSKDSVFLLSEKVDNEYRKLTQSVDDINSHIGNFELELVEGIYNSTGGINKEAEYKSATNYIRKGINCNPVPMREALYDANFEFIKVVSNVEFPSQTGYVYYRPSYYANTVTNGATAKAEANISDDINKLKDVENVVLRWEQGAINYGIEVPSNTRIRTSAIAYAEKGYIDTTEVFDYAFNVAKYDALGNFIGESEWTHKYEFTEPTRFRIIAQKNNQPILPSESSNITITAQANRVKSVIEDIKSSLYTNAIPAWKQAALDASGAETYSAERITSNYMYAVKGSVVRCEDGYRFNIIFFNEDLSFQKEYGWKATDVVIDKTGWIRIVAASNNGDISIEDAGNIDTTIITLKMVITDDKINTSLTEKTDKKNIFASILKSSKVISDWKNEYMTADSVIDITDDGWVYMAYFANPHDIGESFKNSYIYLRVLRFHLCDVDNIEILGTFRANSDVLGFSVGDRPPYDPNILITSNSKVYVYTVLYSAEESIYYWCILPYDIASGQFEPHIKCSLNNSVFNAQNAKAKFEAEGVTFTSEITYPIIAGKIVKYYNEFWTACAFDSPEESNFGGAILKSTDGINWNIVSVSPHANVTNGVCEMQMDIAYNKVYCTMRGYGGTGIFYSMYDIAKNSWAKITQFDYRGISKAWVEYYEDKVFAFYNLSPSFSPNGLERQVMRIVEIDKSDLTHKFVTDIVTDEGCSYPYLKNYHSTLYMSFQSDKRHISTGASRSNICIASIGEMLR